MKKIERRLEALETERQRKETERESGWAIYRKDETFDQARIRWGYGPDARLLYVPEKERSSEPNPANWVEPPPQPENADPLGD